MLFPLSRRWVDIGRADRPKTGQKRVQKNLHRVQKVSVSQARSPRSEGVRHFPWAFLIATRSALFIPRIFSSPSPIETR